MDFLIFGADPLPFGTFYTFWTASLKAYFDLNEFGLQSALDGGGAGNCAWKAQMKHRGIIILQMLVL